MKQALLLALLTLPALTLEAQTKAACAVQSDSPSEADRALADNKFDDAHRLYSAQPPSSETTAGIVRALLGQRKLDEALALIQKEAAAHPADAVLLDALGEVRYRRGEVLEAANIYNQSLSIDPCSARTRYDVYRFKRLYGELASAQKALNSAHQLAPNDPIIQRAWNISQSVPLTPDQQIASLKDRIANGKLTREQVADTENEIKAIQANQSTSCELVNHAESAKIPLYLSNPYGVDLTPSRSGIDLSLNGKKRRFLVDTGASGINISSNAVKALGLTPEANTYAYGIGDSGYRTGFIAHIAELKIGNLEFHNCKINVFQSKPGISEDEFDGGLVGADVFSNFIVTLDFPGRELRLSPLPKRPGDTQTTLALQTAGQETEEDSDGGPLSIAQRARDRFIAPEMAKWTKFYRYGHDIILPTSIGKAPSKLFIVDTGAASTLISPEAASEVTHVGGADSSMNLHGISGEVRGVRGTDDLIIAFAGVSQKQSGGLTSIDTSRFSQGSGVEISGFIGFPALSELVIQIDYRDNLANFLYTPHVHR
jgi:predicted aspartyl protease